MCALTAPREDEAPGLASKTAKELTWTCVIVVALVAAAGVWIATRRPAVNEAQARAMLPVIGAHLDDGPGYAALGSALDARLKPKVFCDAGVIEIRPDGRRWRVGLQINCGEFARRGGKLLEGSQGYPGIADIATLARQGGHYTVVALQFGPPYWDKPWVDQNFSSRAASWILSANPPTAPDPISRAWRAFGFRPGTAAVQQ
jgi:hypothetical protein